MCQFQKTFSYVNNYLFLLIICNLNILLLQVLIVGNLYPPQVHYSYVISKTSEESYSWKTLPRWQLQQIEGYCSKKARSFIIKLSSFQNQCHCNWFEWNWSKVVTLWQDLPRKARQSCCLCSDSTRIWYRSGGLYKIIF